MHFFSTSTDRPTTHLIQSAANNSHMPPPPPPPSEPPPPPSDPPPSLLSDIVRFLLFCGEEDPFEIAIPADDDDLFCNRPAVLTVQAESWAIYFFSFFSVVSSSSHFCQLEVCDTPPPPPAWDRVPVCVQ